MIINITVIITVIIIIVKILISINVLLSFQFKMTFNLRSIMILLFKRILDLRFHIETSAFVLLILHDIRI
jgi:hypothetical protein